MGIVSQKEEFEKKIEEEQNNPENMSKLAFTEKVLDAPMGNPTKIKQYNEYNKNNNGE